MAERKKFTPLQTLLFVTSFGIFVYATTVNTTRSNVLFIETPVFKYALWTVFILLSALLAIRIKFKDASRYNPLSIITGRVMACAMLSVVLIYFIGSLVKLEFYTMAKRDYRIEATVLEHKLHHGKKISNLRVVTDDGREINMEFNWNYFGHHTTDPELVKGVETMTNIEGRLKKDDRLLLTGRECFAGFAIDSIEIIKTE